MPGFTCPRLVFITTLSLLAWGCGGPLGSDEKSVPLVASNTESIDTALEPSPSETPSAGVIVHYDNEGQVIDVIHLARGTQTPAISSRLSRVMSLYNSNAAQAVLEEAYDHGDEDLRVMAVDAMTGRDAQTSADLLELALADEAPDIREDAMNLLVRSGHDAKLAVLAAALGDADVNVRQEAIMLLAQEAGSTSKVLLQYASSDPDPGNRELAEFFLNDTDGEHTGK